VINGTKIDALEFEKKEKTSEDNYQKYSGQITEDVRDRIREGLWNEYIDDALLNDKYDDLGITVDEVKEVNDMLYGDNPPQQLRQAFTDPKTGFYNGQEAYNRNQVLQKRIGAVQQLLGRICSGAQKKPPERETDRTGREQHLRAEMDGLKK